MPGSRAGCEAGYSRCRQAFDARRSRGKTVSCVNSGMASWAGRDCRKRRIAHPRQSMVRKDLMPVRRLRQKGLVPRWSGRRFSRFDSQTATSLSPLRTQGPITTGLHCWAKAVGPHLSTHTTRLAMSCAHAGGLHAQGRPCELTAHTSAFPRRDFARAILNRFFRVDQHAPSTS